MYFSITSDQTVTSNKLSSSWQLTSASIFSNGYFRAWLGTQGCAATFVSAK
jgi:hypothetical protein